MKNDFISIYIHFPFCIKKCMYCNFNSIPFSNDTFDSYISALHNEIKSFEPSLKQRKIQSIYLGGGTPSLAPAKTIKNLLEILPKNSIPSGGPLEVTMETNPGAIASDYFKNLLLAGVTRISFGVQSFNNTFLTEIGRIHDRKQAISAFEKARDAGFRNISIDLMFALPGQTLKEWEQDLYTAVSLQPDHISVYALTPEPGTLLHLQLDTKEKSLPEEETQRAMYIQALQVLKKNGYNHYEISNFSLPGKECIHNMNYWDNGEYAGFGAGAFSFLNTIRRENEPEISTYSQMIRKKKKATVFSESLSPNRFIRETIILNLRKISGVQKKVFEKRFGIAIMDILKNKIEKLVLEGLLFSDADSVRLTPKGVLLSDSVFMELV